MKKNDLKKYKLPDSPGVYFFTKGKKILYIGKATSLKDRVRSYFSQDLIETRGPLIFDMIFQSTGVSWQVTDSVLEALILESNLIKKHQPKYNTKEKDNKSFNYVCLTKDEIPRVLIERGRNLENKKYQAIFGPFPNGLQLREAMKIIRRIFPYIDNDSIKKNNLEFYKQLGLVPGYLNKDFSSSLLEYKNNIKNFKLFFQGRKKNIISNFKKEMMKYAKEKEFEKANDIKKKIFALEHVNDIALIKSDNKDFFQLNQNRLRIESYDIAHLSGKNMVGVMIVVEDGELNKKEYRKFIINNQDIPNDSMALEEVLSRRFGHLDWGLPDLIVVDGGKAQFNVASQVVSRYQFDIKIVSVVKDDRHKPKAIMGDNLFIKKYKKDILLANNEAHRLALDFHKQKRSKNFINNKK